jgi:branched-chain amino acid transport system ATP-binding protein
MAMLEIKDLHAWYGASHTLHGVSISVGQGEVVALVGRNGAGKTTTLRSIMGLMSKTTGKLTFDGKDLTCLRSHHRFKLGLAYVPEDRRIVPGLTVRENLQLGLVASDAGINERVAIDEIAESFPRLKERLNQEAVTMSGGEQQMLAIGRALMSRPRLLLLDEPSLGLAPLLVAQIFATIREINRSEGVTVLLVEQNAYHALRLAHRGYVLVNGSIRMSGAGAELLANPDIQKAYLAGGHH